MLKRLTTAIAVAGAVALATPAFAETLRLSHQWSTSDVRHKIAEMIANDPAVKASGLDIQIFPSGSLFKATEQYKPLSAGQLDMSVYPLSYAGGQRPEYNLTLMPGLIKNHDHAARMNKSPFMAEIEKLMAADDVKVLVHGHLAGGFASVGECITRPEHMKGLQTRAAGKAFEQMLAAAGASISSMASSEIYTAMQTKVLQAVNTSSESFVSFRLYEQVKCYTPAGDVALWFMYQPLLMNKSRFDGLKPEQQKAIKDASAKAEAFYLQQAKDGDAIAEKKFADAGVKIAKMTEDDFKAWVAIAKESSYKKFLEQVKDGQKLLDLAFAVN